MGAASASLRPDVATCPRCEARCDPDQRYCLDCGLPLPHARGAIVRFRRAWLKHFEWYPGDWALPAVLALVIAVAGAAAAVYVGTREDSRGTTFAASTPPVARQAALATTLSKGETQWPARTRGWTVVLLSLPKSLGEDGAKQRAAKAARAGLVETGVLVSDRFASLHPGYYVVFTGIYGSEVEAQAAVPTARAKGFGGAYVRPIVR